LNSQRYIKPNTALSRRDRPGKQTEQTGQALIMYTAGEKNQKKHHKQTAQPLPAEHGIGEGHRPQPAASPKHTR